MYLERHAVSARTRTIATLRQRLGTRPRLRRRAAARARADGRRARRLAATLPERFALRDRERALRQTLAAGVRWGYMSREPGEARGPKPAAGAAAGARLHARRARRDRRRARRLPAAAGVRRRDRAAARGVGARSSAATSTATPGRHRAPHRQRRRGRRARQDEPPAAARCRSRGARSPRSTRSRRGSTRRSCSRAGGRAARTSTTSAGANGRPRSRPPGSRRPPGSTTCARRSRRTRSPPASPCSSSRRVMGTSVAMIERHYGTLLDGAHAGIAGRLDAFEAELERAAETKGADDDLISRSLHGRHRRGRPPRCASWFPPLEDIERPRHHAARSLPGLASPSVAIGERNCRDRRRTASDPHQPRRGGCRRLSRPWLRPALTTSWGWDGTAVRCSTRSCGVRALMGHALWKGVPLGTAATRMAARVAVCGTTVARPPRATRTPSDAKAPR